MRCRLSAVVLTLASIVADPTLPAQVPADGVAPSVPAPRFVGLLSSGRGTWFALQATPADRPHWLTLNATFGDYRIVAFEPAAETIVLDRKGMRMAIRLREAVVTPAVPESERFLEAARAEIRRREGWGDEASYGEPQCHGNEIWVLVSRDTGGHPEARMVILAADGRCTDYWRV